jgi:glyoxylase-like metal-dependent hydrolase (beta-lactamase superfamily II)
MRITSEIVQVGGAGFTSPEDAAVYLICVKGCAAVVDAGCGRTTDKLVKNIHNAAIGAKRFEYLLMTHCHFDHTGGADALRRQLGLKIVAHEKDARFLETGDTTATGASWYGAVFDPFQVDMKLRQTREELLLADRPLIAIHVPGHSPGSVVFLMESDGKKVLFGQDVHGPIHPDLHSDPIAYQAALKTMLDLEADILCEGHFGIFRGRRRVREFIASMPGWTTAS